MTIEESLKRFGLVPTREHLDEIRQILATQTAKERDFRQRSGDVELMKLCCAQLFNAAHLDDVLLIWRAKSASMDSDGAIDIQSLCGAGLEETKKYLVGLNTDEAREALARLEESERCGDFEGFSVKDWRTFFSDYFDGGGEDETP